MGDSKLPFRSNVLYLYTDGSSFQSPRRGGIGARIIYIDSQGEEQIHDIHSPGYENATNNQMELKACILALEEATRMQLTHGKSRIIIRTDSQYVADNYTTAMFEWSQNRWFRRSGAPVLNAGLWKELLKAMKKSGVRVEIHWVKGHAKDEHNRAVDRMAKESAKLATNVRLSLVHVRRKLSDETVEPGSVKMEGQRISIRVFTTEYLPVQNLWKCKYEVVTETSPYYSNVDIVYSSDLLKAGHSYFVQFNDQPDNPRIVKVFRELRDDPE
ncbi:MAG: ribonuclease H [Anaerolineales bacterium]